MNLFHSHSSSPSSFSSSSSSSFDPTMCTSKKATAGCLTGILRRILCSRGLPTHPSDQIRDADSLLQSQDDHELKKDHNTQAGSVTPTSTNATTPSAPGIVARLMGLDSMMEIPAESSAASSLSRSRSMNSVQCFGECDRLQGIHRRVKSTLSFREVPGFTFLENDDNFLVLSFEGRDVESKLNSASMKQRPKPKENNRREKASSETGDEKQSRKVGDEKSLGKNDVKLREVTNIIPQSGVKVSSEKKYINSEAEMFEDVMNDRKLDRRRRRMRRRKKKKPNCTCTAKKTEQESNSEETSPVSVFDFDRQTPGSDLLDSSGRVMSPRRKLSPELGNGQHLLRFDANLMIEQRNVKENDDHKNEARTRREKHRQRYIDIWEEARKKAGEEVVGSNQVWKHGDCEIISEALESEICQHLVNELVDQLLVGH